MQAEVIATARFRGEVQPSVSQTSQFTTAPIGDRSHEFGLCVKTVAIEATGHVLARFGLKSEAMRRGGLEDALERRVQGHLDRFVRRRVGAGRLDGIEWADFENARIADPVGSHKTNVILAGLQIRRKGHAQDVGLGAFGGKRVRTDQDGQWSFQVGSAKREFNARARSATEREKRERL